MLVVKYETGFSANLNSDGRVKTRWTNKPQRALHSLTTTKTYTNMSDVEMGDAPDGMWPALQQVTTQKDSHRFHLWPGSRPWRKADS